MTFIFKHSNVKKPRDSHVNHGALARLSLVSTRFFGSLWLENGSEAYAI